MADEEYESAGKCIYCGETFSKRGIGRHLETHLKAMEKSGTGKSLNYYNHIEVTNGPFFLHILVQSKKSMKIIDTFLRDIWMECCGHMSAFNHRQQKISTKYMVGDVFSPRIKIDYEYDFGSTTYAALKALKQYYLDLKKPVALLSRNEPLKIMCSICHDKPATNLCSVCFYETDAFFCDDCSRIHAEECPDFADYAEMPVVNSPRMGTCGYEGGDIDKARDGVYKG